MTPILYWPDADPDALIDVNSVPLFDVNDEQLLATGDYTAARTFDSYGRGALVDCISCEVTEERNGSYELTMEYPISGAHFDDMELRCIIMAQPNFNDDPQAFRIYSITAPIDGKVTVLARHLSYDLSGIPVTPFTATSCSAACSGLMSNALVTSPFTIGTTLGTIADFKVDVPSSVRSWFGGKEGSLIDVYGGEWAYDNYTCTLKSARGTDRGVVIRYGKNLIDFEQEKNCEEVYTGVLAYWADDEGHQVRTNVINVAGVYDYRRILVLDMSMDFETKPTKAQLKAKAETYITANNIGVPKVNITLDWVQTSELADRVDLCDTVLVEFERLGVSAKAKCISTTWDVLKDRYSKIEFGEPKTNITDTIAGMQDEEKKQETSVSNAMLRAIANATALITGNSGGYVVMHDGDGDGYPDELLVMDTPDISTATKVWRWNKNGLGYSASGYSGTFGLAMTANGEIVADYITTGTLSADRILGGTLSLGGLNNGNGIAKIYDNSGNLAVTLNRVGIVIDRNYTFYASDYSASDVTAVQNILLGTVTPTAAQINKYDLNGDGLITSLDLLRVNKLVNGQESSYTINAGLVVGSTNTATIIETAGVHIRPGGLFADNAGFAVLAVDLMQPLSPTSTNGIHVNGKFDIGGQLFVQNAELSPRIALWQTGNLYLTGYTTTGSRDINFFIPSSRVIKATSASMSSLKITVRQAGGYPFARSGASGGTYTQLGSSSVQVWNGGASYRTNEVEHIYVTPREDGVNVAVRFTYAPVTTNGGSTAMANNAPLGINVDAVITLSS